MTRAWQAFPKVASDTTKSKRPSSWHVQTSRRLDLRVLVEDNISVIPTDHLRVVSDHIVAGKRADLCRIEACKHHVASISHSITKACEAIASLISSMICRIPGKHLDMVTIVT